LSLPEAMPLLPTTMVGSYPRPRWFTDQLAGKDVLEAFKLIGHREAYEDATRSVIYDQEVAGLDILTDGQMWFDDYSMGIGSFLWYWFERIHGFGKEKLAHPAALAAAAKGGGDDFALDQAGGVAVVGPIERGPLRLAHLFRLAQDNARRPIKACVGAGPIQLSTLAHYKSGPVKNRYQLSKDLTVVFKAEIADLVSAGCRHIQIEDLGAWIPNLSGEKDFPWVCEIMNDLLSDIPDDVHTSWHFCLGNAWGNQIKGMTRGGYASVLDRYFDVNVDQYVLDFACRDMVDIDVLKNMPKTKGVAAGVIDVRTFEIEDPTQVADRVRRLLDLVPPERVWLTTDCGMKQLPREVAKAKLRALVAGAQMVRAEL
jgi:5-methyltetrahydropteroyltriglutamate--homocysteine methyltransferase